MEALGLVYAIGVGYLGAAGFSWWYVLVTSVAGTALYALIRSPVVIADIQQRGAVQPFVWYYVAQVVTAAILFGIGRGIAALI